MLQKDYIAQWAIAHSDEDTDLNSHQICDVDTQTLAPQSPCGNAEEGRDFSLLFNIECTNVIWSQWSAHFKAKLDGNKAPTSITADVGVTNKDNGNSAVDASVF